MSYNTNIVVFDLDETLGYFVELGMFWDALKGLIQKYNIKVLMDQTFFNMILDLYPEFLRPNIIGILTYLKKKKDKNHCHKLMIYTNNQGPKEWARFIINYFEKKINYKIFDQIIAAFKIQGNHVEICRTTHMKTHNDLIKCTKIPDEARICFLDDVFYPGMSNEKIYYINLKPYIHNLTFDEMINRLIEKKLFNIQADLCKDYLTIFLKKYDYIYEEKTVLAQSVDKIISKQILKHLDIFFYKFSDACFNTNTKRRKIIKNKTLKKNKNITN